MPEIKSSDSVENQSLKIKEVLHSRPGNLTRIYGVYYKTTGSILGYVNYYSQWKQYAFRPEPGTVWNTEGLGFISEFVNKLNEGRK